MANKVSYKLVANATATKTKAPYIGMAIPVGSLAYENILKGMISSGTRLSAATAKYLLDAFFEICAEAIPADIVRVSTGTVSVYPMISGGFPTEDAPFDPTRNTLYVGASLSQALEDAVGGITPDYAGEESVTDVRLDNEMDIASETFKVIDGTAPFRLAGRNLPVPDGADESIALYTKDGLTKVSPVTVTENDGGQRLTCVLAPTASVAKGTYKLVIKTHGPDPTAPLVTLMLTVSLISAATPPSKKVTKFSNFTCSLAANKITATLVNGEGTLDYSAAEGCVLGDLYKNGVIVTTAKQMSWDPNSKAFECEIGAANYEVGDTAKVILHPDPAKEQEYEQNDTVGECTVTA